MLRRQSVKARSQVAQRRKVVAQVIERDGLKCYGHTVLPMLHCFGPLDPHEIVPRGRRPGGHLDPANVRMVCRAHHDWAHGNPSAATAVGLLKRETHETD
jgi:hypothetical protein